MNVIEKQQAKVVNRENKYITDFHIPKFFLESYGTYEQQSNDYVSVNPKTCHNSIL